jgi:hypothetical protein
MYLSNADDGEDSTGDAQNIEGRATEDGVLPSNVSVDSLPESRAGEGVGLRGEAEPGGAPSSCSG